MVNERYKATPKPEPRNREIAYLSLGSNVGDRERNLAQGVIALGKKGIRISRQSPLYLTEPVEAPPQDWFLNSVVEGETSLTPEELIHTALDVERAFGRHRDIPRGPRTLDIDILFYGSRVIATPELDIPHPRIPFRRFVLAPLAQIAPGLRHPVLQRTIAELLAETPDHSHIE